MRFEVPDVKSEPQLALQNSSTIQGTMWLLKSFLTLVPTDENLFRVAVLVLSGPGNREERENIRKLKMPGFLLTFVFLIGQSGSTEREKELELEAEMHMDLLRLEMEESYSGLPRKTLAGLTYVLSRLPEYDLVIKMDDDLEISPSNLKRALLASRPWQANTIKPKNEIQVQFPGFHSLLLPPHWDPSSQTALGSECQTGGQQI